MKKSKTILKITSIVILILSICCVLVALSSLFLVLQLPQVLQLRIL